MKLNQNDIANLTSMICGDFPFKNVFPYRKTEKLAFFFQNIGLNYSYDNKSQRKDWVESVLIELNEKADLNDPNLSFELKKIVLGVVNPDDYANLYYTDLKKARKLLDKLLNEHNISLNSIQNFEIEKTTKKPIREKRREVASTHKDEQIIIIVPRFFSKPKSDTNPNLVSVMMPFSKDFQEIFNAITAACENVNMICLRADDFWKNSVIIQDIFELIYTSGIVIADFSKRNPNVLYEVGIAHTLGKHVIPIVQNIEDIPFDLHHHRVLTYHDNDEGRQKLTNDLMSRLKTLKEEISSE